MKNSLMLGLAATLLAAMASAQSVTTLVNFNGDNGTCPFAGLTLGPDGNFYGTTEGGGSGGYGTVFKMTTNGALTTLVNFNLTNGGGPYAALTLGKDGNFYGTTIHGGDTSLNSGAGYGTVFQMTTNGTLSTLVRFNNANGAQPYALALGPDGNIYGTTSLGGSDGFVDAIGGYGTVFQMTTKGTLTTLVDFTADNGERPRALTLGPDGNFYGTTVNGGAGYVNMGTAFQMTTNGSLTTLVNFNGPNGQAPLAGLTLGSDGNFYSTTLDGGSSGYGTVFQMTTDGTLTTLVNFNGANGQYPYTGLTLGPDGNFYGTTLSSDSDSGTVFLMTTNGTLITLLHFNGTNGSEPEGTLTLGKDGNFYGTTVYGGTSGVGTVFRLNLPPPAPAAIVGQPPSETVAIGSPATLTSSVTGSQPLAYQWYFDGNPLAGATSATLTIGQALTNNAGTYQLVVNNAFGSVTSRLATLNVLLQPNSYAISNGGGGNLTVLLGSYPKSTNRLWVATNLPPAQWKVIATNVTDTNGLSRFLDTNTASAKTKFYRLSFP